MTDDITRLAAAVALRKMFAQGHFSICTIDQIAKTFGITVEKRSYNTLHLLHCVNYNEMPEPVRSALPELIATCLQGLNIDQVAVEQLLPRPARTATPVERDVTPARRGILGFIRGGS